MLYQLRPYNTICERQLKQLKHCQTRVRLGSFLEKFHSIILLSASGLVPPLLAKHVPSELEQRRSLQSRHEFKEPLFLRIGCPHPLSVQSRTNHTKSNHLRLLHRSKLLFLLQSSTLHRQPKTLPQFPKDGNLFLASHGSLNPLEDCHHRDGSILSRLQLTDLLRY